MKKTSSLALLILLLIIGNTTNTFANTGNINVIVDNEKLEVNGISENGTTLLPLRVTFESLGAKVYWNQAEQKITGVKGDVVIVLKLDNKIATINNHELPLDVPPKLIKGNTYVPVRFIAEALGADVIWNNSTKTVSINIDTNHPFFQAMGKVNNDYPSFLDDKTLIEKIRQRVCYDYRLVMADNVFLKLQKEFPGKEGTAQIGDTTVIMTSSRPKKKINSPYPYYLDDKDVENSIMIGEANGLSIVNNYNHILTSTTAPKEDNYIIVGTPSNIIKILSAHDYSKDIIDETSNRMMTFDKCSFMVFLSNDFLKKNNVLDLNESIRKSQIYFGLSQSPSKYDNLPYKAIQKSHSHIEDEDIFNLDSGKLVIARYDSFDSTNFSLDEPLGFFIHFKNHDTELYFPMHFNDYL